MSTVNDIIKRALRKCGIRDVTDTTKLTEAMNALNDMLESWEGILHYAPTEESFTLTAGTESYTIGSGGDFDTVRPIELLSAFIRDSSGVDYPVDVTLTKQEYDDIADKDASNRPDKLYYAPENPLGKIYFNYAPSSAETFHLASFKPYTAYTATTDTINEPTSYEKAMVFNLAVDLAPEYNITLNPTVVQQATILKYSLASRNSTVPEADFDNALLD